MQRIIKIRAAFSYLLLLIFFGTAQAQIAPQTVDIPTRPGVTQRIIVLTPPNPKATVILFAGGDGGLTIQPDGGLKRLQLNFLIRTRQFFASQGFRIIAIDAPSDRLVAPFFYLDNFRQTAEHVTDVKAVIAWAREQSKVPVWLIGTSRGTQSVAYVATEMAGNPAGPDGIILTSSIMYDPKARAVPGMPLDRIKIPVIVAHHKDDGCVVCSYDKVPAVMDKLTNTSKKQLLTLTGGETRGDPCEAFGHHGFNGIEKETITQISAAMLEK